jgi:hypothetical protein
MKQKTAIRQAIDWVNEIENSVFALQASEIELKMLKQFKTKLQSLEPVNEQHIKDAFDDGEAASYKKNVKGLEATNTIGQTYFNETFEKP